MNHAHWLKPLRLPVLVATRRGYDNRPQTATAAYVDSPLALCALPRRARPAGAGPVLVACAQPPFAQRHVRATTACLTLPCATGFKTHRTPSLPRHTCWHVASTLRPTRAYGLGEGRGDLFSAAGGAFGAAEVGYNPLSNNLGVSTSAGGAGAANVLRGEEVARGSSGGCAAARAAR